MNLELSEDQTMLKDALSRALGKVSTPAQIRRSEASGHDAETWQVFVEMGLPLLRVEAEHGGAGASLMDAVVVAEVIGEFVPVIPAIDTIVAARLLAELGADVVGIGAGSVAALALAGADGGAQLIAAAAVAERIVFRCGDEVRVVSGPFGAAEANLGAMAARRVILGPGAGHVLASGTAALAAYAAALEEWKLLTAAAIAAAAQKAIRNAAEYARTREAFDRPIGSYQGLAHPLAEVFAEVEAAQLLVRRTVEAIAAGRDPASSSKAAAMVRMSAWWAAQACRPAVIKAMRTFGGYGMALESDAQLFFRRVNHWALLAGAPDGDLQVIADRLWGGASAALPAAGDCAISFEYPAEAAGAAAITRRIFEEHATAEVREKQFFSEDSFDPVLYRKLAAEKVLHPDWPAELGGSASDSYAVGLIKEVFVEYDWDRFVLSVADMLGKTIMHFGSERARAEILPRLVSGEAYAALGFSEPSCGSDIFAARTRASRDGEDWIIDGQKMFTSQGHFADYALMLVRTGAGKHDGITLFALPLKDQPGYRCDEIKTVGNERTNATFYDSVRVPDAYRLGEVDGGAKVLAQVLAMEQSSGEHFVGAIKQMLDGGVAWAASAQRGPGRALDDPATRAVLASVATRLEISDVLSRRSAWSAAAGKLQKHFGPSAKLLGSEYWVSCSADLMAMAAPDTLLPGYTPAGQIERQFRRSVPSTIYSGTSEVQRSIIAEAGLGLPRTRT